MNIKIPSRQSFVEQREIETHVPSIERGVIEVMRADSDIIMVGERINDGRALDPPSQLMRWMRYVIDDSPDLSEIIAQAEGNLMKMKK